MRLVMTYQESDDCTYSYYVTVPVIHESPEAAYIDFIDTLENARTRYKEWEDFIKNPENRNLPEYSYLLKSYTNTGITGGDFHWKGMPFNIDTFRNNEYPNFETLDEWYRGLE